MEARTFDSQAATFDARAGLPADAIAAVAAAVARFLTKGRDGALLDVGAGTGELGERLSERCARYVGLDVSRPMLSVFAARSPVKRVSRPPVLVQADAAARWPFRERSFDVVFASRAFHRLPLEGAVEEALRACISGGAFLLGGIRRNPQSARGILRRRLHEALRAKGLAPRDAGSNARQALDAFQSRGCRPLESATVARWRSPRTARETLEAWRIRPGLAGVDLPPATKTEILAELEPSILGQPAEAESGEECYVLEGVRIS
jgi:ubiquinone/menaquinone biosynthesis C-methylase UbiE